jgi:hypothetical protein
MISTFSSPLGILVIVLAVAVIALAVILYRVQSKLKKFLVAVEAENIADSLSLVSTDLKDLQKFRNEIEVYLGDVERRLKKSVQSVHTVRFNPFAGTGDGGKQSFATAFLTEDGDGFIISTLYSRDHVSVYGKPVMKYASAHELSEEEAEALEQARAKLK